MHCADIVSADRENSGKYEAGGGMSGMGHPKMRALGIPGGGGLATAADLSLLYQPLINGGAENAFVAISA
jgi:hypothetical protein